MAFSKGLRTNGWLLALACLLCAGPARALEITFINIGGYDLNDQQIAGLEMAADIWEARLTDRVDVVINVKFTTSQEFTPATALAAAFPAKTTHHWATAVLWMMIDDASGADELGAVLSLNGPYIPAVDHDGNRNVEFISMTTANARALGLSSGRDERYDIPENGADGTIKFNVSEALFDYDRDGIGSGSDDFVTVAAHEIGHVLGFLSSVEFQESEPEPLPMLTLDIWRFPSSASAHDLRNERRKLKFGAAEYDDLVASEKMSRGTGIVDPNCREGGICQADHFQDAAGHLMDAKNGGIKDPTDMDLHALDFIGWDLAPYANLFADVSAEPIAVGDPQDWLVPTIPGSAGYPPPLPFHPASVNFTPNLNLVAQIDFGGTPSTRVLGGRRTLTGYLELKPEEAVEPRQTSPAVESSGWEQLRGHDSPMTSRPARICNVALRSDTEGAPFEAVGMIGRDCTPFQPRIGAHGGWRLPMCLNGNRDGTEAGDCDARLVLNLALDAPHSPSSLEASTLIGATLSVDFEADNDLRILDAYALGMADRDGDNRPDVQDNCANAFNPTQDDHDHDGIGSACDPSPYPIGA